MFSNRDWTMCSTVNMIGGRGRKSILVNLVTYPYVSPTIEENDDCLDLKVLIILYENCMFSILGEVSAELKVSILSLLTLCLFQSQNWVIDVPHLMMFCRRIVLNTITKKRGICYRS